MSRRARNLIGIATGAIVAALLWSLSGSTWGRTGSYPLVRKAFQIEQLPGSEGGHYRIFLNAPPSEAHLSQIVVSRDIYNAVQEGDTLDFRARTLPLAGIQAYEFHIRSNAGTSARWKEGFFFLYVGIGIAGLAAALLGLWIAGLIATLLRMQAPPDA